MATTLHNVTDVVSKVVYLEESDSFVLTLKVFHEVYGEIKYPNDHEGEYSYHQMVETVDEVVLHINKSSTLLKILEILQRTKNPNILTGMGV